MRNFLLAFVGCAFIGMAYASPPLTDKVEVATIQCDVLHDCADAVCFERAAVVTYECPSDATLTFAFVDDSQAQSKAAHPPAILAEVPIWFNANATNSASHAPPNWRQSLKNCQHLCRHSESKLAFYRYMSANYVSWG